MNDCFHAGTWSSPIVSGIRPPPCRYFSFTMIDDNHVVLFGGSRPEAGGTNEVYTLDLRRMVSHRILN